MAYPRAITYKVDKNGCWNCTSHKANSNGYPVKHIREKCMHMSRYIYMTQIAPIPDGMVVRHKCDNSLCINPSHLELGTQGDNVLDMFKRGRRTNRGTFNPRTRLTESDVLIIRNQFSSGKSNKELATLHKISVSCIQAITSGKNWKYLRGNGK